MHPGVINNLEGLKQNLTNKPWEEKDSEFVKSIKEQDELFK